MAEAILFHLASKVVEKIGSLALKEVGLAWGLEDELKTLEGTLSTINAVLIDAGQKTQGNNLVMSLWLERLQAAFYEADNVLDEFHYEILFRQVLRNDDTSIGLKGMPEIVHDLAVLMANEECSSTANYGSGSISEKVKHVPFHDSNCSREEEVTKSLFELVNLRTIFLSFQGVGANDTGFVDRKEIQRLTSLQSFCITGCGNLTSLPEGMQLLVALRTVMISACPNLTCLPSTMKNLAKPEEVTRITAKHGVTALQHWGWAVFGQEEKIGLIFLQEIGLLRAVENELLELQNKLSTIGAVLLDAEEQQAKNRELCNWLGKLKDAFTAADDLLDEFEIDQLQQQFVNHHSLVTRKNYQTWAVRMTAYLQAVDLWEAVEADYEIIPLPDNPTIQEIKIHKERTTKKYKAKSCLHSAVSEAIFTKIMTLESAKNIWDYLRTESQGNDRSRSMQVMNLRREFEIQRMKESETIKEYSDRLLSIVNKVRLLGEDLSDQRVVEKILVTIPERFESKISSLEESKDLTSISLAEFLNALQAQEQRRLIRQEGFVEGALKAKLQIQDKSKGKKKKGNKDNSSKGNAEAGDSNNKGGTYPQCQHCKKTNHPQSKCWWRPDIKCRKCNQLGHIEKVCRSKQQQEGEAKMVDQQEEEHLFVASCYASKSSNEHWLVDSGCTNHMTYDKELFKELDRTKISKVKVGNGEFIEVRGKGTVAIESVLGYKLLFEDKKCMIRDADGREVCTIKMRGKCFSLDPMKEEQTAYQVSMNTTEIWHKRLGHFHHGALIYMQKNQLVQGLPPLEEHLLGCKACQYGKQSRLPFPKKAWRASQKLQLIHTDLGGPQRTPSLKGTVFWKFKAWVENQSGYKMQVLRSDNGKEYTSEQFDLFCEEAGIEHQLTAPYTPQQNGVSERKNRTLMEMTRCLLHEKGLQKKFWAW
ncbi:unnamed protein product [Camellia sinensis]